MPLQTDNLGIKLVQESWQFADKAFNDVIEDIDKKVLGKTHELSKAHWEMWEKNKQYQKGDVVRTSKLKSNQYMLCTNTGTSGANEPTINTLGSNVIDGSTLWQIRDIAGSDAVARVDLYIGGNQYTRGQLVLYGDAIYRSKIDHLSAIKFEDDKDNWQEVYSSVRLWKENTFYYVDDTVLAEGMLYKCIKEHTSKNTFAEDEDDWELAGGVGGAQPWEHNKKYQKYQLVTYMGSLYRAKVKHESGTIFDKINWEKITSLIEDWKPNTTYETNTLAIYDNKIYKCKSDHTSTATFDKDKWTPLCIYDSTLEDFKSNHEYKKNTMVLNDKKIYRAKADFTSAAAFNKDNWDLISNSDGIVKPYKKGAEYKEGQLFTISNVLYKSDTDHTSTVEEAVAAKTYTPVFANISNVSNLNSGSVSAGQIGYKDNALYISETRQDGSFNDLIKDPTKTKKVAGNMRKFVADARYDIGDYVVHEGNLYECKSPNVEGNTLATPDDAHFDIVKWDVKAEIKDWQANTEYKYKDVVRYNGKLYRAKGNIASKPEFNYNEWDVLTSSQAIRDWNAKTFYEKDSLINMYDVSYQINSGFTTADTFTGEFSLVKPQYSSAAQWKEGAWYQKGVTVESEGALYRCTTDHKSVHGSAGFIADSSFLKKFPGRVYKYYTPSWTWHDNFGTGFELDVETGNVIDHILILDSANYIATNIKITAVSNGVQITLFEATGNHRFPRKINIGKSLSKVKVEATGISPEGSWYGGMTSLDLQIRYKNPNWEKISEPEELLFPKFAEPVTYHENFTTYNVGNIVEYNGGIYICTKLCTNYNGFAEDCWTLIVGKASPSGKSIKTYTKGDSYKTGDFVYYDKAIYIAKADVTTTTDEPQETDFDKIGGSPTPQPQPQGTVIADWDKTKDYDKGDMVFYEGKLYRASTAITHAENFQTGWEYVNPELFAKDWIANKEYQKDEIVFSGGILYRAKAKVNKPTFEEVDWEPLSKTEKIKDWQPNTPYKKDEIVVYNSSMWRAGSDHTSTGTFDANIWENLSGGGSGSVAGWKQITKLNTTANTKVTINFPETLNFCFPPIDVLQLQPGTANVIMNSYTFDVGDGSRFEYDANKVVFDGTVHCNTEIPVNMSDPTALGSWFMSMSDEIDFNNYNNVWGVG